MNAMLNDIVAKKHQAVQEAKRHVSVADLETQIAQWPLPLNLAGQLWGDEVRLIAEIKKASPSRGLLSPNFDPESLADIYTKNGACAISVLTDSHFMGSLSHLASVKTRVKDKYMPVLRKDFIFDSYQLYEARAYGADAVLLIIAILAKSDVRELMAVARTLNLQCLVEVHNETELEIALGVDAEIIGVNNRDLHTFTTDLMVTKRLVKLIPRGKIVVSESGINSAKHVLELHRLGVHAVLVGEALVTASNPGMKINELMGYVT